MTLGNFFADFGNVRTGIRGGPGFSDLIFLIGIFFGVGVIIVMIHVSVGDPLVSECLGGVARSISVAISDSG